LGEDLQRGSNPIKASRTHQELHKELLLAHKKGKGLCSKPELQQVLERHKKEQTQKEERDQARTPLEEVLLTRQQKNSKGFLHLLEFVRVRQNLKKIQAFHKATNS
uniref:Si:ch211-218o21.4 n=1 Tax=Salmo trutta TaxID=8032 RepID=A0A674DYL6_SALTR